jgi:hypothetical protein
MFNGCEVVEFSDEDRPHNYFRNTADEAFKHATNLKDRIMMPGKKINMQYWNPTRPAYGSRAYEQHGQADDVAWEQAQG